MAEAGFAGIRARVRAVPVPRVSHIVALYLITGVCGLVDAACFLSMGGVFAEIMTGNLLFLCFHIGTGQSIFGDAKYLLVIAAFLLGATAGCRLLRGRRAEIRIAFSFEWGFLVIALILAATLHPGGFRSGPGCRHLAARLRDGAAERAGAAARRARSGDQRNDPDG